MKIAQFTDIKLFENILQPLGIDVDTADGYYLATNDGKFKEFHIITENITFAELCKKYSSKIIPSWSIEALISVAEKLLPGGIISRESGKLTYRNEDIYLEENTSDSINSIVSILIKLELLSAD